MHKRLRYIILFALVLFSTHHVTAQTPMPDNVCVGDSKHYWVSPTVGSTYIWKIDGVVQTENTNEIFRTWNVVADHLLEIQETTSTNCTGEVKSGWVYVQSIPDLVTVALVQPTCVISTGTVTISSVTTGYSFNLDGSGYSNSTGIFTLVAPGVHTISAKNSNGCISPSTTLTINALPLKPSAIAGFDRAICLGASTQIGADAITGSAYTWSSVPVGFTSAEANPTVTPLETTTYTIIETNTSTGCTNSNNVLITVNPVPVSIATSNSPVCSGGSINLIAQTVPGGTYFWTGINGYTSTYQNPVIHSASGAEAGIYTLTISANGCTSTPLNVIIMINNCDVVDFHIPEGFSPNGDAINDFFVIKGIDNYPKNKIVIYNRWGDKIFEASPYKNHWDGKSMRGLRVGGDELPIGTYFYILDLGDGSNVNKGTIYLNR